MESLSNFKYQPGLKYFSLHIIFLFYRCSNGRCVPERWRCDKELDCVDGDDEAHCNKTNLASKTCTPDEFTCSNGNCILVRY